jgi:hypothetical protein
MPQECIVPEDKGPNRTPVSYRGFLPYLELKSFHFVLG